MAKEVRVVLEGSLRKIEPDSFQDRDGNTIYMTRVKLLTGSLETGDEDIHDINYIWKKGPDGRPVAPSFLQGLKPNTVVKLPARVVAAGNEAQVRGV